MSRWLHVKSGFTSTLHIRQLSSGEERGVTSRSATYTEAEHILSLLFRALRAKHIHAVTKTQQQHHKCVSTKTMFCRDTSLSRRSSHVGSGSWFVLNPQPASTRRIAAGTPPSKGSRFRVQGLPSTQDLKNAHYKIRSFVKVPRDFLLSGVWSRDVGYSTLRDQPRRATVTHPTIQHLKYALF